MRSKIFQQVLDETPKEVEERVRFWAQTILNNNTLNSEYAEVADLKEEKSHFIE